MRSPGTVFLTIVALSVWSAAPRAWAAEEEAAVQPDETPAPVAAGPPLAGMPIYRPDAVGKPARTVGGGSRGPGDGYPALYVLVPDHVARTVSRQPTLLWYIDAVPKAGTRFEFTLLAEAQDEPTVKATLPTPMSAGIHRIQLADYGALLAPGSEYEWNVALVPDPEDRAKDIVSTGWIDCVERSARLDTRLSEAGSSRVAFVLAEEGLWYDALAALDAPSGDSRDQAQAREMRAALLRQVGLEKVALRL
jgi:hypothetical protein